MVLVPLVGEEWASEVRMQPWGATAAAAAWGRIVERRSMGKDCRSSRHNHCCRSRRCYHTAVAVATATVTPSRHSRRHCLYVYRGEKRERNERWRESVRDLGFTLYRRDGLPLAHSQFQPTIKV